MIYGYFISLHLKQSNTRMTRLKLVSLFAYWSYKAIVVIRIHVPIWYNDIPHHVKKIWTLSLKSFFALIEHLTLSEDNKIISMSIMHYKSYNFKLQLRSILFRNFSWSSLAVFILSMHKYAIGNLRNIFQLKCSAWWHIVHIFCWIQRKLFWLHP